MSDIIVDCHSLSKKFRWYERHDMLKGAIANMWNSDKQIWEWYVLNDLNFQIRRGERVGIVGRNGCGKTTLLKLLTGIYSPTAGSVRVNTTRELALIELGVGFYPDLTGRENIRLNWLFNGLPKKELKLFYNDIVEFAGVGDFLETPLKYYSSGMTARLGFSIVAHARPELLIVDEILAVGDIEFQRQCYAKIEELCDNGVTLILVSHNSQDVERICNRAIWLDAGRFCCDGPPTEVIHRYETSQLESAS